MGIAERYEKVEEELAQECALAGRDPKEVRLVAVSKTVGVEGVGEAYAAGARDFGENRPDQIVPKSQAFPDARWHFIGNIQSRRIRDIVDSASLIHSVYQEKHARKIDEVAREKGIVQDILIEVNVSGEESKSGVSPDEAETLVDVLRRFPARARVHDDGPARRLGNRKPLLRGFGEACGEGSRLPPRAKRRGVR